MLDLFVAMAESDCEQLRSGWLTQPANAISCLAFVAVGSWVLLGVRQDRAGRGGLIAGGIALIGTGLGSLAYHGPQPGWAHLAHDGSALVLAVVVVGRTIWQLVSPTTRSQVLGTLKSVLPWAALALSAYVAGRSGSPLCRPATIWQPHAAWHVLCAVTIGAVLRMRSEGRRVEAPAARVRPAPRDAPSGGSGVSRRWR